MRGLCNSHMFTYVRELAWYGLLYRGHCANGTQQDWNCSHCVPIPDPFDHFDNAIIERFSTRDAHNICESIGGDEFFWYLLLDTAAFYWKNVVLVRLDLNLMLGSDELEVKGEVQTDEIPKVEPDLKSLLSLVLRLRLRLTLMLKLRQVHSYLPILNLSRSLKSNMLLSQFSSFIK